MENSKVTLVSSAVVLVFLTGLLLRLAKPVFFPFFLAILFYFILSPVLSGLMRLKIPKAIAVSLIIVTAFFLFYLMGVLFYSSGRAFAASLPDYAQRMNSVIGSIAQKLHLSKFNWDPWMWSKTLDASKVANLVLRSMNQVFSFFSTFVLIFVFLMFMLAGRGKLKLKVERAFSHQRAAKINQIVDKIDRQVQKYLVIKTGISFLSGTLTMIVLLAFGVDFALLFGFLTFLLNFIPSLGSIVSMGLASVIAAFQFGSIFPALWIFILLVGLDAVISNLLEPKLMGQGLGLSPLAVLFSLFFWGWLWGIPGMILAVPIMAVIKIVCANIPSLMPIAVIMSK
ncbi:MAG: putative PurR-regulated permease PerM [Candidatus Aminicenantes bacterium]|nr:putative PurR-regulated permease PerM [Candidatus Aminicenantes bacterium]